MNLRGHWAGQSSLEGHGDNQSEGRESHLGMVFSSASRWERSSLVDKCVVCENKLTRQETLISLWSVALERDYDLLYSVRRRILREE